MRSVFRFLGGTAVAAGVPVLLCEVYRVLPNPLSAVLSPVNDSPWELSKALFWSCLAAALLMRQLKGDTDVRRYCAALLTATALCCVWLLLLPDTPCAAVWLVCALLGAVLYVLLLRVRLPGGTLFWYAAVLLLGIAFILFTTMPPMGRLFTGRSSLAVMATIPY